MACCVQHACRVLDNESMAEAVFQFRQRCECECAQQADPAQNAPGGSAGGHARFGRQGKRALVDMASLSVAVAPYLLQGPLRS